MVNCDDMLVFSGETGEVHMQLVLDVVKTLEKAGAKVNWRKPMWESLRLRLLGCISRMQVGPHREN